MNGAALVIDTSLLVLFVVGSTRRELIERHKRLRAFSPDDFELLRRLVAAATQVLVTPNTLTEASNLIGQIDEPARSQIRETFRRVVLASEEEYLSSRSAVAAPEFIRLGLTDATLLEVVHGTRSLLTTDFDLYQAVLRRGAVAVNFNHLREEQSTAV